MEPKGLQLSLGSISIGSTGQYEEINNRFVSSSFPSEKLSKRSTTCITTVSEICELSTDEVPLITNVIT